MAKVLEFDLNKQTYRVLFKLTKKEVGRAFDVVKEFIIFSKANFNYETSIVRRGARESTQYILIPKALRLKGKESIVCKFGKVNDKTFVIEVK